MQLARECGILWILRKALSSSVGQELLLLFSYKSSPNRLQLMDSSPQCSSLHCISQARILEWIAISFLKDLPNPVMNLCLQHWQVDSLPVSHQGNPAQGQRDSKHAQVQRHFLVNWALPDVKNRVRDGSSQWEVHLKFLYYVIKIIFRLKFKALKHQFFSPIFWTLTEFSLKFPTWCEFFGHGDVLNKLSQLWMKQYKSKGRRSQ